MWRFEWINFGWNNQQKETGSNRAADTSLINKIYSSCFVCLRCCLLFGNSDIRMHWFTITRKQRNLITSFWLVILRISSKKEMIWRKQPKATSEECSQYSLKKFKVYKTKVIYISIKKAIGAIAFITLCITLLNFNSLYTYIHRFHAYASNS